MDKISGLSDDLLVKILSFVPTKVAVSTSILSKRWEFLWMWVPKLEFKTIAHEAKPALRDFINKNLPLHRAPVIESLHLDCSSESFQLEDIKQWVEVLVSRNVRELSIYYDSLNNQADVLLLPISLYTCESLVTLKLTGFILVDVPRMVSLPSLKTLELVELRYLNEASLRLLLSYCPVLEELTIERNGDHDNAKALVVIIPSLKRLSLAIGDGCFYDGYVIVTPSLKYLKVEDDRDRLSYLIDNMPKLDEADVDVQKDLEKIFQSITSVKRLSLRRFFNRKEESLYRSGIVFNQLEHLKLYICNAYWSKLLVRLLRDSPKLRVLNIYVDDPGLDEYERISWDNKQSSVPKCLLKSLETFEFVGYMGRPEERDFLSFIFKNACCLESTSILR